MTLYPKASKLHGTEDQLQVTQRKLSEATAQLQLKEEVRNGGKGRGGEETLMLVSLDPPLSYRSTKSYNSLVMTSIISCQKRR